MLISAGIIEKLELKGDWLEATRQKEWQESSSIERIFHPRACSDIDIVIYFRQVPVAKADGTAFRELLQLKDRLIDASDIVKLGSVTGGFGDKESAMILRAGIRNLSGKPVLEIDGRWLYSSNLFRAIIIDSDGSGLFPQQVYLMAPEHLLSSYIQDFDNSMASIVWRS